MGDFRKGQMVNVINSTMSGTFFVEGRAKIVKPVADVDCQYVVDFMDGYGTVERFVDPLAQGDDVAAYVGGLNDR